MTAQPAPAKPAKQSGSNHLHDDIVRRKGAEAGKWAWNKPQHPGRFPPSEVPITILAIWLSADLISMMASPPKEPQ